MCDFDTKEAHKYIFVKITKPNNDKERERERERKERERDTRAQHMATKTTNPTTATTTPPPPAYDSLTTNRSKNESSKLEDASSSVGTSNHQNVADENASSSSWCASLSIQELRKLAPNTDRLGYDASNNNNNDDDEREEKIALTCHVVNPKKIGQGMNTV